MIDENLQQYVQQEKKAWRSFKSYLTRNKHLLNMISSAGDGRCGAMLLVMQEILGIEELPKKKKRNKKKEIPYPLRKYVLERDMYRCMHCGTHLDLSIDHIIPECDGGPTTLENLQTLCAPCNTKKGTK